MVERIRTELAERSTGDSKMLITASFGVAQLRANGSGQEMVVRADRAMYRDEANDSDHP